MACGISLGQGLNPRLLHWQHIFLPLSHQGSPLAEIWQSWGHGEQLPPHLFPGAPVPILLSSPLPGGACISHPKVKVTSTFYFFLRCRFSWRAHPQEFSAAELLAVLQEAGQLSVSWGAAHITSTAWGEHRTLHGYTRTAIQPLRQSGIHWDQVFLLFTPKWPFYMSLAEKGAFLLNLDSPNWALRHEEVEIGLQSLGAQKGRCQQIWAESRICSGSPRLSPVYIIM